MSKSDTLNNAEFSFQIPVSSLQKSSLTKRKKRKKKQCTKFS